MPVFQNLDGTTSTGFQIGKVNPVVVRNNGGVVEWQNSDGIWHKIDAPTYIKVVDPTVNDDSTQGYLVGNSWANTVGAKLFICTANTAGAATWLQIAGSGSSVNFLNFVGGV